MLQHRSPNAPRHYPLFLFSPNLRGLDFSRPAFPCSRNAQLSCVGTWTHSPVGDGLSTQSLAGPWMKVGTLNWRRAASVAHEARAAAHPADWPSLPSVSLQQDKPDHGDVENRASQHDHPRATPLVGSNNSSTLTENFSTQWNSQKQLPPCSSMWQCCWKYDLSSFVKAGSLDPPCAFSPRLRSCLAASEARREQPLRHDDPGTSSKQHQQGIAGPHQ